MKIAESVVFVMVVIVVVVVVVTTTEVLQVVGVVVVVKTTEVGQVVMNRRNWREEGAVLIGGKCPPPVHRVHHHNMTSLLL